MPINRSNALSVNQNLQVNTATGRTSGPGQRFVGAPRKKKFEYPTWKLNSRMMAFIMIRDSEVYTKYPVGG